MYEFINKGNSFLEIPKLSLRDEGNFTCAVSNEFGYAKKMYRLCVISKSKKYHHENYATCSGVSFV